MSPPVGSDRGGLPPFLVVLLLLSVAVSSLARESEPGDPVRDEPSAPEKTARDVLRAHGLPIGLLPRGVMGFRIDGEGRFEAQLEGACNARFENDVHYDANVTGTLSYGRIGALSGISAHELFLWFPVKGIRVDIPSSGLIYFDVEVVQKQFALSLFDTPPECKVDQPSASNLRQGKEISRAVEESKYMKLKYDVDQEDAPRTAIL